MRQFRKHFGVRIMLTALVLLCMLPDLLSAQEPAPQQPEQPPAGQPPAKTPEPGFRSRIVDVVVLESKERLFGILAPDQETRLLTRCDWLRSNASKLFTPDFDTCLRNALNEQPQSNPLLTKLQQTIETLDQTNDQDRRLAQILQETSQRVKQQNSEPPGLVILEIPRDMVRRRQSQPENIQQLGLLAFLNKLPQPELLTRTDATQMLQQIPPGQLVSDLPNNTDRSEEQLLMILAAADFRADRKGTIIQSGDTFVADDGTASIESILPAMLQQNMQKQISDLLGEGFSGSPANAAGNAAGNPATTKLDPKAAAVAQRNQWTTVELTSFDLNIESDSAQVHRNIFHRRDQDWVLVHRVSFSATSADLSDEQQQEIRNDPQIQTVLQLFGQLGTNEDQITRAIRLGAVVKTASARSSEAVQDFVSNSLRGEFKTGRTGSVPTLTLKQN